MIRAAVLASALGLAVPAAAQVRYFEFTIDGFTDGATITGTFASPESARDIGIELAIVACGMGP